MHRVLAGAGSGSKTYQSRFNAVWREKLTPRIIPPLGGRLTGPTIKVGFGV